MKILARLLPLGLLMLTAAGDRPALAPSRDVTVSYHIIRSVAPGGPSKLLVMQNKGGAKMRIESYIFADGSVPYEGMIVDRATGDVSMLLYARQIVVVGHTPDYAIPGITMTPDMNFKRGGKRTIAGVACTDWEIAPPKGEGWTACITGDGVVLRVTSPKREMEATSVAYAPLLASIFVPDKDLHPMMATGAKP
jgi:hypothetical protein